MAQRGLSVDLFSTVYVDQWDDELCDLVDVNRLKFMEAQGAQDRPPAIHYLSIHCVTSGEDN